MKRPGLTIMELMIYMAIATAAVLVFMNFMIDVTHVSARTKVMKEVDQQARYVLGRMVQDVRGATAVVINGGSLVLTEPNGAGSDTVIYSMANDTVQYQLNAALPSALTTSAVKVASLSFNLTGQLVTIDLTVASPASVIPAAQRQLHLVTTVQPHKTLY